MKRYKTKYGKAWNMLKNHDKFKPGQRVKIIKNNGLEKYNNLVGEIGWYDELEIGNKEAPFQIFIPKIQKTLCFSEDELEKI